MSEAWSEAMKLMQQKYCVELKLVFLSFLLPAAVILSYVFATFSISVAIAKLLTIKYNLISSWHGNLPRCDPLTWGFTKERGGGEILVFILRVK